MTEPRLVSTWETLYKDNEGEGHVETLHKYEYPPEQVAIEELLVRQAPPIRITPSKRKRSEVDWLDSVAGIGDIHFPFQDDTRLKLAEIGMKELQPTIIALLGDNLDFANYSRFETRKEWSDSTQRGIDQYAEFLGRLRADHPDARIVWLEGNHDQRMEKRIREYNEDVLGIRRAGEATTALSLDFLLRCEELDVEYEKGYPSSRMYVRDQLEIHHGHVTNGRGLAASKVIEQSFMSFMTGHTHQLGMVSKTFYVGEQERTIYGVEAGTYANPDLTPSGKYAPGRTARHNWQSGLVQWLVDDEMAIPRIHHINDQGIEVNGRFYRS